jgi:hypothetical protein
MSIIEEQSVSVVDDGKSKKILNKVLAQKWTVLPDEKDGFKEYTSDSSSN